MKTKSQLKRMRFRLRGVVQGVGMRPFVYRLAKEEGLSGFVYNDGRGVIIEAQGSGERLDHFKHRLSTEAPPAARLDQIEIAELEPSGVEGFRILKSPPDGIRFTRISPDLTTCPQCLAELNEPSDRRHHYPFINCTNCGPRLTIIRDVPYDRARTTMTGFQMCPDCQREYDDPSNRRFHAQPNACPICGPKVFLLNSDGKPIIADDPIRAAAVALQSGLIVALKGIGGMHLACDAANAQAVARLRARKYREEKPFALMVGDLERAHELAYVNTIEADLLTSVARPIVVLDARPDIPIAPEVSPGLETLGLMLPYTPLHHLLLASCNLQLVMTSGNLSEEPIAFKDDEIVPRLKGIADLFLLHDRPIHLRCDDSVVRVVNGKGVMLRRSRGYVPNPIRLPRPLRHPILACGAELKSTFCLGRDDYLILSHHLGDLENQQVLEAFEDGVDHFQRLFYAQPESVACDLHPDYLSTQYAEKRGLPLLRVQHHHAHALACLAESGDFSPTLAWTLDGIGLGTDGTLWGGECLKVDGLNWDCVARLRPISLPGGAQAIREPWRTAVAALLSALPREGAAIAAKLFPTQPAMQVEQMLEKGLNCPLSSGAGRLFDAVAALAGIAEEIVYEGQAAILLEAAAQREFPGLLNSIEDASGYHIRIVEENHRLVLDWTGLMQEALQDRLGGLSPGQIGARFHVALIRALREASEILRKTTGINRMVLTGGVFQNRILLSSVWRELETAGFEVLVPSEVPINDGGIALGQAAALWLQENESKDGH